VNVLMTCPNFNYPPTHGGGLRVFNLLKQVARRHTVHVLTMYRPEDECATATEADLRQWAASVRRVPRPTSLPFRLRNAARSLGNGAPYTIANFRFAAFETALRETLRDRRFDLVHAHNLHTAQYYDACGDVPVLFDCQNLNVWLWERYAETQRNPVVRRFARHQASLLRRFEPQVHQSVAATTMCSDGERDEARSWSPDASIHTVPNGVDLDYFAPQPQREVLRDMVVFTASFDAPQNSDAARWLLREVFPRILARRPDARLVLVGRNPSAELCAAAGPRVTVTGTVVDVRPFVAESSVFIAPIRIGSGTRLKILEAMAMAKPVVSTTVGAEGIAYRDGEHLVIADTPDAFAERVVALFDHPEEGRRLGAAGRALVKADYDWYAIGDQLEEVYAEVARKAAHA
jgi:sugar transferase (PEP-CTERM/EpsH1 system associated)